MSINNLIFLNKSDRYWHSRRSRCAIVFIGIPFEWLPMASPQSSTSLWLLLLSSFMIILIWVRSKSSYFDWNHLILSYSSFYEAKWDSSISMWDGIEWKIMSKVLERICNVWLCAILRNILLLFLSLLRLVCVSVVLFIRDVNSFAFVMALLGAVFEDLWQANKSSNARIHFKNLK